jgi:hypothetical protein
MYITAHRVRAPTSNAEGINAFFYVHGSVVWDDPVAAGIPDENPGTLMAQSIALSPPSGNRVRSYLDIVAPDETPWPEVRQSFVTFVSSRLREPLPWAAAVGRCYFRIGVELGLMDHLEREIADLYQAGQGVRVGA